MNADGANPRRLTHDPVYDEGPRLEAGRSRALRIPAKTDACKSAYCGSQELTPAG